MATTTMVHVRVDEKMKAKAAETLAAMGLSISDAVRVFLTRVVAEKQLPFALKVPNAETRAAMEEADEIVRTHRARFATATELFNDLEKNSGKQACPISTGYRLRKIVPQGLGTPVAIRTLLFCLSRKWTFRPLELMEGQRSLDS